MQVELNQFRHILVNFSLSLTGSPSAIPVSAAQMHSEFQSFSNDFDRYVKGYIGKRQITQQTICAYVYQKKISSQKYREYLIICLDMANRYLKALNDKIKPANISNYKTTLDEIQIDYEHLIARTELEFSGVNNDIFSGRKRNKESIDILRVGMKLFNIEDYNSIKDLYVYDLRPYSVFAIRQCIEQYGKDILGYVSITDSTGGFSKKHLRSAWDFIKKECNKKNSRIKIPFNLNGILAIERWSNRFVHTSVSADCYIIWQALEILKVAYKPAAKPIVDYTRLAHRRFDIGEITIVNYNSVRADFETFVNEEHPFPKFIRNPVTFILYFIKMPFKKSVKKFYINWLMVNHVKSYIISL